jgi:hypothetical protein
MLHAVKCSARDIAFTDCTLPNVFCKILPQGQHAVRLGEYIVKTDSVSAPYMYRKIYKVVSLNGIAQPIMYFKSEMLVGYAQSIFFRS